MNAPANIVASLDAETLALVDRLATSRGISGAEFAAEAIRRVAETEADFDAFIKVGIEAADRGDLVDHAEVMAELDAMIAKHRAR